MKVEWLPWLLMLAKENSAFSRNIYTPFTQLYKLHIDRKEQKKKREKEKKYLLFFGVQKDVNHFQMFIFHKDIDIIKSFSLPNLLNTKIKNNTLSKLLKH